MTTTSARRHQDHDGAFYYSSVERTPDGFARVYSDEECIGFVECRCPKCLASPAQQAAKVRVAAERARNAISRPDINAIRFGI